MWIVRAVYRISSQSRHGATGAPTAAAFKLNQRIRTEGQTGAQIGLPLFVVEAGRIYWPQPEAFAVDEKGKVVLKDNGAASLAGKRENIAGKKCTHKKRKSVHVFALSPFGIRVRTLLELDFSRRPSATSRW